MQSSLPTLTKNTSLTPGEIQLLSETYFKDLTNTEMTLALKQVQAMELNPFNKEIYAYKIHGRLTLVTGIAGFRKIAHRSGDYLGCIVTVLRSSADQKAILSATATVKKLVKNHVASFEATVLFDEYNQKREKWLTMPEAMIRKTAEINALKMAFPNIEALSEENNPEPMIETFDELPTPEKDTQEVFELGQGSNTTHIVQNQPDPGEQSIKFKRGTFKINSLKPSELQDFLKWAYAQPRLADTVKMSVVYVEEFLKSMEVPVDSNQEATKTQ